MSQPFTQMLTGGHRNSLGRTEEVVQIVTGDPSRLAELFACLDDADEVVRMRAGDALEKVCRVRPEWFEAYLGRILDVLAEWAAGDPALGQWLRPQLERLSGDERKAVAKRATKRLAELRA